MGTSDLPESDSIAIIGGADGPTAIWLVVHPLRIVAFILLGIALGMLHGYEVRHAGLWSILAVAAYLLLDGCVLSRILPRCFDIPWHSKPDPAQEREQREMEEQYVIATHAILLAALDEHCFRITREMLTDVGSAFVARFRAYIPSETLVPDWDRFLGRLRAMTWPDNIRDGEEISVQIGMANGTYRILRRGDGPVEIIHDLTAAAMSGSETEEPL